MTDRELILAAQTGDTEAFGRLVVRYQRSAYGHAVALLGDREAARDAIQDSFLAAFRALPRMDPQRPFFPWFYVTLRNRCFSILRRGRSSEPLEETCLVLTEKAPDERCAALRDGLCRLAVEDREILVLKYIDGHRYTELAELLSISVAAVTSRLRTARGRLAKVLRDEHNPEA